MNPSDLTTQLADLSPERRRALELLLLRERARERVARDLFTTTWRAAPVAANPKRADRNWLVIADKGAIGTSLVRELEQQGARCKVIHADAGIDAAVLREWLTQPAQSRSIAFLSALDDTLPRSTTADTLMRDQERVCSALLSIIGVIAGGGVPEARLWIFTRGAQRLPGDTTAMAVSQATLLGLGRTFGLEHPELHGGLVDLDPNAAEATATLATQLVHADAELETAWRGGERFIPRMTAAKLVVKELPQRRLPPTGTYLITGGTSELALFLARWLIGQGARSLVLMSRSEGDAEIARQRRELEATGATVRVALGDVSKLADVERVVADIGATLPALRGVVHAAAVVDYGMVGQQTWARFAKVLAPKVAGTWNLHVATRELPLDFFVMYSSLSALGYEASANYAAANSFMDAFAHARRAEGLPATAINWTAWSKIGGIKKLSKSDQDRLTATGIGYVDPDDGMHVMSLVMAGHNRVPAQVIVHPITDADKLRAHLRSRGEVPYFSELLAAPKAAAQAGELSFLQRVRESSRAEAEALVDEQLRASTMAVLGLEPNVTIEARRPLVDIGMTSLLANDFRLRLAADVGMPRGAFPATLAFNYPTIEALRTHILDDIVPKATVEAPTRREAPAVAPPPAAAAEPAVAVESSAPTAIAAVDTSAIAVVGMACRFPGGAETPEELWRVLTDSADLTREVPKDRWDAESFYDADPDAPGRSITRNGTFVSGWDLFDPTFFNMSPREAAATDPQQRLLLELAWAALADAGYSPEDVFDTRAGVFAAVYGTDYIAQLVRAGPEAIDVYTAAGIAHGVAAGRLSYALGVHGPSITLDAACSSSLVAIHLAAQSLRKGECDVAIVGASSAMLGPNGHLLLTKTRMISPDGRSKAFDASADGYGRSEGGCVIVLKRADDAVRNGDTVHALVRGTAVNQDGRSASLVAPNGPAQEEVLRAAMADAKVSADDIDYVECAGTGSAMGDAIEYGALAQVFGQRAKPVVIGSVKTNIGHTESVSGLAGLMKLVLAFRHEALPPHLHLRELNPECRPQNGELVVGAERRPWRRGSAKRIAGVQSYGMSGTNAHVILEEPPRVEAAEADAGVAVLRLSARSAGALDRLAKHYARYAREYPSQSVASICRTAERGRSDGQHRLAVVARDRASLIAALQQGHGVEGGAMYLQGEVEHREAPRIAFAFAPTLPLGLAQHVAGSLPADDTIIGRCAGAVRSIFADSLSDVLAGRGGADAAPLALVASYAVQCALWEQWRKFSPTPHVVTGQGLGEIAAAYATGIIGLEQGAALVAEVARRAIANLADARWLVVDEDVERVKAVLGMTQGWSVVAVNGQRSTSIGGTAAAIDEARRLLVSQGVAVHDMVAPTTLHTRLIEVTDADIAKWLPAFAGDEPSVTMVSSVTGRAITGRDLRTPQYWSRLLRSSVQARDSFRTMAKLGATAFVEVGDGSAVLPHLRDVLGDDGRAYVAAIDPAAPADMRIVAAFAKAYTKGLSMAAPQPSASGPVLLRAVDAPTYELDRERCWLASPASAAKHLPVSTDAAKSGDGFSHPLLGLREVRDDAWVYRSRHSTERLAFLRDHGNYGTPIFPGMAFIEMAFAAAADAFPHQPLSLADVTFERALLLDKQPREVELVLKTRDERRADYVIRSRATGADTWLEHTRGVVQLDEPEQVAAHEPLAAVRARLTKEVSADALYDQMKQHGQDYGAAFRGMTSVWRPATGVGEALGRIELPRHVRSEVGAYRAHPALLDACGHPTYIAVNGDASTDGSFMFAGADTVRLRRGANVAVWSHVVAKPVAATATRRVFSSDIHVYDDDGRLVAELLGVRNLAVGADSMVRLATTPTVSETAPLDAPLLSRPVSAGAANLRELVSREVASALGMAPDRAIGGKQVLKDLGLDSLVAVQLRNRLQAATGASLPVTLLFEYPTVQALVDFLTQRGVGAPKVAAVAHAAPAATVTTRPAPVAAPVPTSGKSSRLSAVLAAIDELDEGELDVLATEILGEGR